MRRPIGFTVLALLLGLRVLIGFLLAIGVGLGSIPLSARGRGLTLLLAVFAAVAAEALWRCRPWCLRASVAYVGASILLPLMATAASGDLESFEALFTTIGKLMIAAVPLLYVHSRATRLFGRPAAPARVPIAVPRP